MGGVDVWLYMSVFMCVCVGEYVYTCVYVCVQVYVCGGCIFVYMCESVSVHVCGYLGVCACGCVCFCV